MQIFFLTILCNRLSRRNAVAGASPGFFQVSGVFLELGHFDKHSPIARERKAPQGKNLQVFCLETLKNFILNNKFYLKMTTVRAFFLQFRALFSNFQKRAGGTSPPSPFQLRACVGIFASMQAKNEHKKKTSLQTFSSKSMNF